MFELERDQIRKTYQLCRIGFFLLTVSLVPACILSLLAMIGLLGDRQLFNQIVDSPWNQWVYTLSVWGSLAGAMLLWGRWDQKSWQRGLACCWSCAWSTWSSGSWIAERSSRPATPTGSV